jgi:hypothetical protein
MTVEHLKKGVLRALALAACIALGILAIVGSGGGAIGFPDTTPNLSAPFPRPVYPSVGIDPTSPTVQAGTIVRFEATVFDVTAPLSYQWYRDRAAITGATSSVYQLGGAQAGDDLAYFSVIVEAANGVAVAGATLRVSPLPPVAFEDTDFPTGNWNVSATPVPDSGGPAYAASQAISGGNPAAYRLISNQMSAGTSSLRLVHTAALASYSPAAQGAIYTIDFAVDCRVVSRSPGLAPLDPTYTVVFGQAGRVYQVGQPPFCGSEWRTHRGSSVLENAITLLAGPACGVNERCPDFSATAATLHFGFTTMVRTASASTAGTLELGIDNWKVTVWRK